jgi:hypothetical protein
MDNVERVAKVLCGRYEKSEDNWRLYSRDATAAIAAMEGWRPIEEAPRDGTQFIAATEVCHLNGAKWWERHIVWIDDETDDIHPDAYQGWSLDDYSHFLSLPAPPQHGGADA